MLMTTTNTVDGRAIADYVGIVSAQVVLGVNAFKDVSAGVRNIFGGRSKSYENELSAGVAHALDELEKQGAAAGGAGIVGIDVDYETVGTNMLMISASGTAVTFA